MNLSRFLALTMILLSRFFNSSVFTTLRQIFDTSRSSARTPASRV